MRVAKPKRLDQYLRGLVDFLNAARPAATENQWRSFLRRSKTNVIGGYFHGNANGRPTKKITLPEAKGIRSRMHRGALAYLWSEEGIDMPYAALVARLSEQPEVRIMWQCRLRKDKPRPGQATLRPGKRWKGKRWEAQSFTFRESTEERLYGILGQALIDGSLNNLKVCRWCGEYIVVTDTKRDFCPGTSCKDNFFNKEKLKDGTFQTARRKRRLLNQSN